MSRQLLCPDCAAPYLPDTPGRQVFARGPHGEPAEYIRVVTGRARQPTPAQRTIYVNDTPYPLDTDAYTCDSCSADIRPGDPAVALSIWLDGRPTPPAWEAAFLEPEGER